MSRRCPLLALSVFSLGAGSGDAVPSLIALEAEAGELADTSNGPAASPAASGGKYRSLLRGAKLSLPFTVSEGAGGSYRVFACLRGEGSAAAVQIRFDDGNAHRLQAPAALGFRLLAASPEPFPTPRAVSGSVGRKDGFLSLRPTSGYAFVALGASIREGAAEGTLVPPLPNRAPRGRQPGAFFFLGDSFFRSGLIAGVEVEPGRFVIGSLKDGRALILAEKKAPLEAGRPYRLRLELERTKARLFRDRELLVEADIPEAPSRQLGLAAASGEARFADVLLREGSRVLLNASFAEAKPSVELGPGAHRLTVEVLEGKVALDQCLLVGMEAGRQVSAAARRRARASYLDLLGRPPTEIETLLAAITPPGDLARRLLHDPEFFENWYEQELYYFLLIDNFRPSGDLLVSIPERLASGEITVREALWQITICPEFNARNPGADTFVTVVLEQLLGMTVQKNVTVLEAGKKLYDGYPGRFLNAEGKNQSDVVKAIFDHPEFPAFYLNRLHARFFGEPMPAARRKEWTERFAADPRSFRPLLEEWFASDLYENRLSRPRLKNDSMFVESLFVDFLGRPATQREHRNVFNALQALSDSGPIRMVMAKMLIDSGQVAIPEKSSVDFPAWIEDQFLKLYARRPSAKEKEAFASLWKEPGCDARVVLEALATHREYQYY